MRPLSQPKPTALYLRSSHLCWRRLVLRLPSPSAAPAGCLLLCASPASAAAAPARACAAAHPGSSASCTGATSSRAPAEPAWCMTKPMLLPHHSPLSLCMWQPPQKGPCMDAQAATLHSPDEASANAHSHNSKPAAHPTAHPPPLPPLSSAEHPLGHFSHTHHRQRLLVQPPQPTPHLISSITASGIRLRSSLSK
jgi:hypothetical protein